MLVGKVKWFNNPKGYGFILASASTNDQDVLVHYSVIQMEGFKTLKAGQKVNFKFIQGPKGLTAVIVEPLPFESGVDDESDEVEYIADDESTEESATSKESEYCI